VDFSSDAAAAAAGRRWRLLPLAWVWLRQRGATAAPRLAMR
jgi:hypothetical protein